MLEISVAIPVFNQQRQTLEELVRRIEASVAPISQAYEIILVDDGSTNDAWAVIRDLAAGNNHVKGLQLARNFGQHAAITAALDSVCGNWVVVMDADLQDRPEVIPQLYAEAQRGFDIVFVSRKERPISFFYRIASACFYLIFNLLSDQKFDRSHGSFSIVSSNAIKAYRLVREDSRFYNGILNWIGFRHSSIEAWHDKPRDAKTTYTFRKKVRWALSIIVGFSSRLLYTSIIVGLILGLLSFILAVAIVLEKLRNPSLPIPGWPSVITAVFFIGGVTNMTIGFVGLYIGQILQQTKGRPLYIISQQTSEAAT